MTIPYDKGSFRNFFTLKGDKTLWAIFFILTAISLIEVYSAASTLTFKSGDILNPIIHHGANLLIGFVCVFVFHKIPCGWFKFWIPAWAVFLAFLIILPLFGTKVNDGARWIDIMGIHFQPSEFAKGSLVVIVAFLLSAYQTKNGADRHAFKLILIATILTCFFIFLENFSTAGILFFVVMLMMFFGRVPMKQLGKLLLGIVITIVAVIILAHVLTTDAIVEKVPILHRLNNFTARIDRFMGLNQGEASDSTKQLKAKDFDIQKEPQVGHAHIAIAKSNIIGCGPGNSRERDFLPQAYSDFIFAIIIEELGLVGGAVVVLLYIILLFRASRIANRCERNFPAFVILGLAMLIVVQAAVNMSVAVGLIPVTGQPLPLVSRGGSSIMVTSIYFGMMISISHFAKKRDITKSAPKDSEIPPETDNTDNADNTD